jgi:hypothetical protein
MRCACTVAALLFGAGAGTAAQQPSVEAADTAPVAQPVAPVRAARFGVWFTGGWHAPISNYSPLPTDREVLLFGIERRVHLVTGHGIELSTSPSLLPMVYTTGNRRQENVRCRDAFSVECEVGSSYPAYGFGMLPASLRIQSSAARRLGFSVSGDAGGALFNQRVPATKAARFNFVARFGADVVVRATGGTWLSAGYRHLHMSNGGTGDINPGIDTPLWSFGFAWR